jgi:hypothetical protein
VSERRGGLVERAAVSAAPTSAPSSAHASTCLNCGTLLEQHYCPACGQAAIAPDPTLGEFLHEMAQEFLRWDGKLFTTFRLLVTRPGELTREYLAGRRVGYLSPLRLYLTCSVLYFFLRALAPDPPVVVQTGGGVKTQVGGIVLEEQEEGQTLAILDRMARTGSSPFERAFGQRVGNALRHRVEFAAAMRENTPRMMFVLVPLFAALAALVFRNRRMRYPKHLTFALHAHAFLFLALIPTLVPRLTRNGAVSTLAVAACFLGIGLYLVLAIRRVYGGTIAGALGRGAVLALAYLMVFLVALLTTVAIVMAVRF